MKVPTREELEAVVNASLEDPTRAMGARFDDLVWGDGGPPQWWRDVPLPIVRSWDVACRMWAAKRPKELRKGMGSRRKNAQHVSRETAWSAVISSASEENVFLKLAWRDIATKLGLPSRSAQYQLVNMGFEFTGKAGTLEPRKVTRGPCVCCGEAKDLETELSDTFHCSQCRTRAAA